MNGLSVFAEIFKMIFSLIYIFHLEKFNQNLRWSCPALVRLTWTDSQVIGPTSGLRIFLMTHS